MASAIKKKPCAKCSKGVAVATCDGCQQSFCMKDFVEHRQELSHQMDSIGQEHDLLQRDLNQQSAEHPLLSSINTWEQESITKIQVAAETARADLQELLDGNKKELKKSVNEITDELQSSRESDGYTEVDINKWIQQLQVLRKTLETLLTIYSIAEDEAPQSIIRLIRVRNQQQHCSSYFGIESLEHCISAIKMPSSSNGERFDEMDENGTLSEQNLIATHCSASWFDSIVCGANRYSFGTHHIRFRIDKIGHSNIFFGINASSKMIENAFVDGDSLYGWWDLIEGVMNSRSQRNGKKMVIRTGDEVTLTLDCDNQQIQLQHHRTNQRLEINIDLDKCPFPWRVVVQLSSHGDIVRILQ